MKKRMITGVQPTGCFTLANYIGAIKNFVRLQSEHDSYIFIADLHGITSYQDPQKIHTTILDLAALYVACGVDTAHTNFFVQSDVVNSQIKSGKNLTLNKGVFEAFYLFFSNCFRKLFSFSHFNVASKVSFFIQNKTPVPKRGFYHYLHSIYFICTCFIF